MAGKKAAQDKDPRQELLKELRGLIKDIDEEGLLFLIKQTNTLKYNQRVDELNRESEKIRASGKGKKTVEPTAAVRGEGVLVERGAFGRSFILEIKGTRKTFAESEMLGLVKVGRAGTGPTDGAERLFRWLQRNRDDLLLDAGIPGPRDPVLQELWKVLGTTFSVREE